MHHQSGRAAPWNPHNHSERAESDASASGDCDLHGKASYLAGVVAKCPVQRLPEIAVEG